MAVKRYKAGTIFLDVAPSFDKVQEKIKRYIEKESGLNDAFEKQGREHGQRLAEGEAEGYEKASGKVRDARVRQERDSGRSVLKVVKENERATNSVVQAAVNVRLYLNELEKRARREHAADIRKSLNKAAEDQKQFAKDLFKTARDEAKKNGTLLDQMEKDRLRLADEMHQGALAARKRREDAQLQEAKVRFRELDRLAEEQQKQERQWAKEEKDRQRLADEMHRGRLAARKRREDAELQEARVRFREEKRLARERQKQEEQWAREEKARRKAETLEQKAAERAQRRADREAVKAAREAARERERILSESGGRIGRLIRKSVGNAVEDLPPIEVDADSSRADKVLADVRKRLIMLRDKRIGVDIDAKGAMTELASLQTGLKFIARTHDGSVRINALAALASLQAVDGKINEIRRNARRPIILRLMSVGGGDGGGLAAGSRDGANAFRSFNAMVLAVVAGLSILGPALTVVGAGLVTLAGAAVAGAAGLGVLALGFQGVFQAIQDQIKAEDDAAKQMMTGARQRARSARQIQNAQEGVADAERNAARASEDASRRVEDAKRAEADTRRQVADDIDSAIEQQADAERRLEDAQRSAAQAQRDLSEARREARRDIEDLAMSYRESQLAEKEAAVAIIQAQERLSEVRRRAARGDATTADVRSAEIDVSQARLRAEEARNRRRRAGEDSSIAQRRGVEGSDEVRNAKDRARQANQAVIDAQRDVAKATKAVSDARTAGARRIADAERGVTDALKAQKRVAEDNARSIAKARRAVVDAQAAATEQAEQMSTAAFNARQSMDDLSPAGQKFARFVLSLRKDFKQLRDVAATAMLPGLQAGMSQLAVYRAGFRKFVGDMGTMWGNTFRMMGEELTGPTWSSFFNTLGKDGPRQAGLLNRALLNVATTIAGLLDAFSPMTTEMLTWLERATRGWAEWAANLKGSPGFERFLEYVRHVAPIVKDFLLALGKALINVFVALAPYAEGLLKVLTGVLEWVADMDPKVLGMIATGLLGIFFAMQFGSGAVQLLVMLMQPFHTRISMVVSAVTLLVVGLIYLYQTNDKVRVFVDRLLVKLKELGGWMLNNAGTIAKVVGVFAGLFVIGKIISVVMALRRALMMLGITMKLTFLLNPWVLAIAALVGAIIYLWKTNESFRDTMKAAWDAIKRAVGAVVDWFVNTAGPAMGRAFTWVAQNVLPVLRKGLQILGQVITWLWESVVRPYIGFMVRYWSFVFSQMARLARWFWNSVLKPVFQELARWVKQVIAPTLRWLWKNVFEPAFRAIGRAARAVWNDWIKPSFKMLVYFIKTILAPAFRWLWSKVISPVFTWIGSKIGSSWKNRILPIFKALRWFLVKVLGPVFRWLWKNVVKPSFEDIAKIIKWAWDRIRPNFGRMKKGLDTLKDAFLKARDGIEKIWKKLSSKISGPIDKALKFIQEKFIDKINSLLKKAGLELRLPTVWGKGWTSQAGNSSSYQGQRSGLQRAATGGMIQGPYRGATADNVLGISHSGVPTAWVNPKEFILPVRATERLYSTLGHTGMEALRRGTLPGYAKGGIVELGKRLQKLGYHVSEHPEFGGVAPGAHAANGYHYKGGALDINADPFNSKFKHEASALDRLNRMLRSEGWNTIWRAAGHYDHLHVDIANGQKGGLGGMLGGIADKALEFVTKGARKVIDKIPGDNIFADMSKSLLKKSLSGIKDKISGEAAQKEMESGVGGGGGDVSKYRTHVRKALWELGQPASLVDRVLMQMRTESGGNPRSVNRWDSNWKAGHPSVGLMQVIRGTYAAYKHPRFDRGPYAYGVSMDPMSNIMASMRYALATYGSLTRAYRGRGYWKGTNSAHAGMALVGERGPELVNFDGGEQVLTNGNTRRTLAEINARGLGGGASVKVYVQNPWTGDYLLSKVDDLIEENDEFKSATERMN